MATISDMHREEKQMQQVSAQPQLIKQVESQLKPEISTQYVRIQRKEAGSQGYKTTKWKTKDKALEHVANWKLQGSHPEAKPKYTSPMVVNISQSKFR